MRLAIYLLVFVNLLLFALAGGLSGGPAEPAGEAALKELSPGRIRIVSRDEAPAVAAPVAASPAAAPMQCVEWRALTRQQADRVALASEGSGALLTREVTVPESSRWWLFIQPLAGGKAGVDKKVAELRKLGIRRFAVVEDEGEHHYAISFGHFAAEAEAQKALDALRQKGVRSARLLEQGVGDGRESLTLRASAEAVEALRASLAEVQPQDCVEATPPKDAPGPAATSPGSSPAKP